MQGLGFKKAVNSSICLKTSVHEKWRSMRPTQNVRIIAARQVTGILDNSWGDGRVTKHSDPFNTRVFWTVYIVLYMLFIDPWSTYIYLILETTLGGRYYYYCCFQLWGNKSRVKLSPFPQVWLVSAGANANYKVKFLSLCYTVEPMKHPFGLGETESLTGAGGL